MAPARSAPCLVLVREGGFFIAGGISPSSASEAQGQNEPRMSNLSKADIAQALKHPLRRRLLPAFIANRPLSPKEASRLLKAPLSDVSYHVKVLVEYEFLVLRARAQVKGAVKSYYLPNDEVLNSSIVKEFFARNPSIGNE